MKVEGSDVTGSGISPAPLAGTDINVGGSISKRILVSNAIPDGTTLTAAPSAPAGWTAVYTTDPLAGGTAKVANDATWSTIFTPGANYTRVGFVSNTGVIVSAGLSSPVFTFSVTTSTYTSGITYTVDSIAQAFGSTSGGTPTVVVYDESGDQTPNNYDSTVPLSTSTSTLSVAVTTGTANGVASATYGIDNSNSNTGTGLYGEINRYIYTYTPPTPNSLLNGPQGAPTAQGPDGSSVLSNNFDFTNKSSAVGNQPPGSSFDPDKVGFFNTVQNTGTSTANISLLPELLTTGALPVNTIVRIHTGTGQSATYIATSNGFAFVANSGVGTSGGVAISETNPVMLENVAPNATAEYQVEVNLLPATTLSTDSPYKGFPVVINAFIGNVVVNSGNVSVGTSTASNKTIDRIYTGFIRLVKESRILKGLGPDVAIADLNFSTSGKNPAPGNIIEYKITYTNISEPQVGSGNGILKASNLTITEDGTTGGNTWGKDSDNNGTIDTSNVVSSTVNVGATGTVERFKGATVKTTTSDQSGTTADDDVTKYVDTITTVVEPATSGSFSFQRKLN